MKLIAKSLLVLAGTGLVASCGEDSKDIVNNVTKAPELQGTYNKQCASSSVLDLSYREVVQFQGNDFTQTEMYFVDDKCEGEKALEVQYIGTFTADEAGIDGPQGSLDIELSEVQVTPNTDDVVTQLVGENFCGIQNLTAGETYTLKGQQTQGLCPVANVPVNRYGAFQRNGDTLKLDSAVQNMATAKADRNTEVNTEYIKD